MNNYWMGKITRKSSQGLAIALLALPVGFQTVHAAEVKINVTTETQAKSRVGCALFKEDVGFPMDLSDAEQMWQEPQDGKASCVFENLTAGNYAVAVFQDLNGNDVVDRNFWGVPQEPWAVSNNVRHRFREPSFAESQFKLTSDQPMTLDLTIKK